MSTATLATVRDPPRCVIAGAAIGAALLTAPGPILHRLTNRRTIDRRAVVVARLIGARHLLQAAVIEKHPSRGWMLSGAAIDTTHAASMIALAIVRPNTRRLAILSAALALVSAGAAVHESHLLRPRGQVIRLLPPRLRS